MEIKFVVDAKDMLGESPVWRAEERALYWLDNLAPCVKRFTPATGDVKVWEMPEFIGSIGLRKSGGFVAGMGSGFAFLDLDKGPVEHVVDPEPETPNTRLNDGKGDKLGRFWCGSMNANFVDDYKVIAALYRFDPDGTATKMDDGFIVSNGIAFSPDDKVMYFSDSSGKSVFAYDFDLEAGTIANRRPFISSIGIPGHHGKIDGATVDTEGHYWGALVYDGLIGRFDPEGRLVRTLKVPVSNPTMCTFGGDDLDVMYVTSTRKFVNPMMQAQNPLEGGLLAITGLGVQGLPEPRFAG